MSDLNALLDKMHRAASGFEDGVWLFSGVQAKDVRDLVGLLRTNVTAPTPERRVGEERLVPLAEMDFGVFYQVLDDARKADATLIRDLALDLLDERAANARLTAEVERLRGVLEGEIEWLDGEAMRAREQEQAHARLLGVSPSTAPMVHFFNRKDKLRAALSPPTPAPEATE